MVAMFSPEHKLSCSNSADNTISSGEMKEKFTVVSRQVFEDHASVRAVSTKET